MINTAHEHILFKFKNLNKNIPAYSCLLPTIYISNLNNLTRIFLSHLLYKIIHVSPCILFLEQLSFNEKQLSFNEKQLIFNEKQLFLNAM